MFSKTLMKGELACSKFDIRALEKGGISSKPIIDVPYDRVLDFNENLYRIQIKYANGKPFKIEGAVQVDLRRTTKNRKTYKKTDIDALVVYIPKINKLCWFNRDLFIDKYSLFIRYLPSKNNQKKGCLMVENYIW